MKPLEALQQLQRHRYGTLEDFDKKLSIIEKSLKALEIIKKKLYINCDDNGKCIELKMDEDQYYDYSCIFCDTKEEYELLKEILND